MTRDEPGGVTALDALFAKRQSARLSHRHLPHARLGAAARLAELFTDDGVFALADRTLAGRAAIAPPRLFALSTRGTVRYDQPEYRPGDAFLFGPETRGLPQDVLDGLPPDQRLRLPMRRGTGVQGEANVSSRCRAP